MPPHHSKNSKERSKIGNGLAEEFECRFFLDGVILSAAVFQAERRISRGVCCRSVPREIPRPAGKSAGLGNDAGESQGLPFSP